MIRLAVAHDGGTAVVSDRSLVFYDAQGARGAEHKLDKRGSSIARFGDEWLVLGEKQKHLGRVAEDTSPFANGKAAISAFAVGRDDAVAVVRDKAIELWSRDDKKQWSTKTNALVQAAVARDHVVALEEEGALVFLSRDDGALLGALRLASPEPVDAWRLVHVDACVVVLALGDWLVWIDTTTRKTIRRVRARAKVTALAADPDHVAVAVEDGFVQAFRATTGEPKGSVAAEDVTAIALGTASFFVLDGANELKVNERASLDVTVRTASPICAVSARGGVAAIGDRSGHIRVVELAPELRDVRTASLGEAPVGLHVAKDESVLAAGARVLTRLGPQPARPIALRGVPTAFAADDAYAFVGSQTGSVDVYDLESARNVTTYSLSQDDRITSLLRIGAASLVVGTGALDGRVLIVDIAESKVVHRLSPHDEAFGVTCLAADARGRLVASGSDDGSIVLIDPAKGRILARIRVTETPMSLAFEPSGRRLACVYADGTAAIVAFEKKGATVSDLGVRGASHVGWGDGLVFGFKDGHAESGERHARPSDRPAARQ